jgi:hypothetical protein
MYNRTTLDRFDGFQIGKDKSKSKVLKKQIRQKKKSMALQMGITQSTATNQLPNTDKMLSTFGSIKQ